MNEVDGTVSLKAFLDGTADGACAVNSEGVIVAWNAAAEKIFRCRAKKAVGRMCREILDARDAAGNSSCSEFCTVRNHFTRCEPLRHFELRSKTDVGDHVWLDVSVLLGGPKAPVAWILLFRDVTRSQEIKSLVERLPASPAPPRQPLTMNWIREPQLPLSAPYLPRRAQLQRELTRRELQILWFMKEGISTETIADRLSISPATVRNHIQNLFTKLDVHNRLEAVALATRWGL